MQLTVAEVKKLIAELEALPAMENDARLINKSEAIKMLVEQIDALQKRGYTYEMIAHILTQRNLPISVASLKTYFGRAKVMIKTRKKPVKIKNFDNKAEVKSKPDYPVCIDGEKKREKRGERSSKSSGFSVRRDTPDL